LYVDMVLGQPSKESVCCNQGQKVDGACLGENHPDYLVHYPPKAGSFCHPYLVKFDNFGNLFVVEDNYEGHGNIRIVMYDAQDLNSAVDMFPNLEAKKVFIKNSFTAPHNDSYGFSPDQPQHPISLAFNSRNQMVVGNDGYMILPEDGWKYRHLRQLWFYDNPLKKDDLGNYIQGQKPDAYINLPMGAAAELNFDEQDNLIVQDHVFNRIWVLNLDMDPQWLVPQNGWVLPTPNLTPRPAPTSIPTPTATPTRIPTPTMTPTPTVTPTLPDPCDLPSPSGCYRTYHGAVTFSGEPKLSGSWIAAWNQRGGVAGCQQISADGVLPSMRVYQETESYTGMRQGEEIIFLTLDPVSGDTAVFQNLGGPVIFGSCDGSDTELNLVYPPSTPSPTSAPVENRSVRLFGTEDNIACVDIADNNPRLTLSENFSIEVWIKPESSTRNNEVIFNRNLVDGFVYSLFTYDFSAAKGAKKLVFAAQNRPSVLAVSDFVVPVGSWSHIGITKQGTLVRGYVNGEKVFEKDGFPNVINEFTSAYTSVGCTYFPELEFSPELKTSFFNGLIDDLRVSNTARNIESNWRGGLYYSPLEVDKYTLALWKFDNNLEDSSEYNHSGGLLGDVNYDADTPFNGRTGTIIPPFRP